MRAMANEVRKQMSKGKGKPLWAMTMGLKGGRECSATVGTEKGDRVMLAESLTPPDNPDPRQTFCALVRGVLVNSNK